MNYLRNVATIAIVVDKCTGCGVCLSVCPRNVLAMRERTVEVINRDACLECGACYKNCAFDAITVDSGVGCAAAMIDGLLRFGNPDSGTCDCSDGKGSAGCC